MNIYIVQEHRYSILTLKKYRLKDLKIMFTLSVWLLRKKNKLKLVLGITFLHLIQYKMLYFSKKYLRSEYNIAL